MQTNDAPRYARISVWGLTLGFAAAALVLGLITGPLHFIHLHAMMGQGGQGMMRGGQEWNTGTLALWYVGALLAFSVMAGIAGAVAGAVHNLIAKKG